MEADGDDSAPDVEFGASTLAQAEQFAALVNDAREKTGSALSLIESGLPGEVAAATRRSLGRLINPFG